MRVLPNMTVIAPSDATQTSKIVELMTEKEGPMYSRVGRADTPLIYDEKDIRDIDLGKGIFVRDGSDITIISCGTMVSPAMEASEKLLKKNISARVIDMHTIKPLDEKIVMNCIKETNGLITVEEHSIIGGLGSSVAEVISDNNCCVPFVRMGIRDRFCESGDPEDLLEKYELNQKYIEKNAEDILKKC